ncbi:MAG: FAD-dependent oxidoreductase [Rhodospirillales bacterium]
MIIGGGFAGCAAAHQLALLGSWDVTLVEAAPFLGAGVRTSWYGGHPHTFGPRHFLTQNEEVYSFLNKYLPLRDVGDHIFLTYVESDQQFYNFPIHRDDVPRMPEHETIAKEIASIDLEGVANAQNLEEYWIASVGRTLYDKFIDRYSKKMWMLDDNRLIDDFGWSPKGVALKEGPRAAWDIAMSCYPYAANGYDDYFDLSTAEATVLLGTRVENYDIPNRTVSINGERRTFDIVINTISPDLLFECCHGELPYVGRDFYPILLPCENAFPDHTYFVYYAGDESFTRIVEYKKFTRHESEWTLLGLEIPSTNGRHYPLPFKSEYERADKYFAEMPENVFSIGRAGSYRYRVDIDDCIEQAMDIAKIL